MADILRCARCRRVLDSAEAMLQCAARHRFEED